jgi:L,D-peptidoglycan transpeptidase YkuD (ErfK/YbiS/YcfS/YnhG family)
MMKKLFKWLALIVGFAVFAGLLILLMVKFTPSPPAAEVDFAREALSKAGRDKADTYSTKLYNEARAAYDSAMANWKRENAKFLFFRNFEKVEAFARLAAKRAGQATTSSQLNSNSLKIKVREKIDSVNKTASGIDHVFGRYPLDTDARKKIAKGNILLKEAEVAYSKGQYIPANTKINEAEHLLTTVFDTEMSDLKDYFNSLPTWKKWAQQAISESEKNKSYSILVDKFSKKCYVYLKGEKKFEFDAELGINWVGNKRRMGDKATPEGIYKVVNKFQGKQTEYYKSLSLDYPNPRDMERFKTELSKGSLPAWAKIGGGIEIHGGGGKGVDWTEGCIALTNSEIDIVYNIAKIGTPVIIVGSTKDLSLILENELLRNGNRQDN